MDFSVFGGFLSGFNELFKNIPSLIMILFSLLFVTFFDTTGTLIPLAKECGYVKEDGTTEGINNAFISDALGGIVGAIFGSSTVTAYVKVQLVLVLVEEPVLPLSLLEYYLSFQYS